MNSLHVKRKMPIVHDEKQTNKVKRLLSNFIESTSQSREAILCKVKFPWYMYSNTHTYSKVIK